MFQKIKELAVMSDRGQETVVGQGIRGHGERERGREGSWKRGTLGTGSSTRCSRQDLAAGD